MAMVNTLEKFLKDRGVKTPYQFWKDTGLAQSTAYRLYRKSTAYPSKEAQDAICRAYDAQPGDFLRYIPDRKKEKKVSKSVTDNSPQLEQLYCWIVAQPVEESDRTATEPITTEEAPLQEQAYQAYDWEVYYRDGATQPITEIPLEVDKESDHAATDPTTIDDEEVPPLGVETQATEGEQPLSEQVEAEQSAPEAEDTSQP